MRTVSLCILLLTLASLVTAQQPAKEPLKATPEQQQATAAIHQFFRRTTNRLADNCLADIKTLDDWQEARPQLRQQLLEMLGLSPLPEKTDLKPTITGTTDGGDFVIEKLYFQSRPGLYVTANFYRPKQVDKPLPTILYVCGHGNVKIDNISYGSKASYQHHPAWFVREGYCCLILDTLQLGEIEGFHHGTYRMGMWWWPARGYTPAGVEAWNCVRALDYLETRPEVDMKKIGVTGRSGGGAYSWWIAAIDDRPACVVPVAGITDLENHVIDGTIEGHCDCMFMVNTYAWDFATVAALCAPRPLLFSNTDKDGIFPLDGVVRTHAQVKRIYDLHKAGDKLGLLITEGGHKDTQELQVPAFRWMSRWLKEKQDDPITRIADKPFDPKQLRVYTELPADQRNTTIHETFVPQSSLVVSRTAPSTKGEWEKQREDLLTALKEKCFRNWPQQPDPLDVKVIHERVAESLHLQALEFTTEEGQRLPVYVVRGSKHAKPSLLVLTVVDTEGWRKWLAEVAPGFGDLLPGGTSVEPNKEAFTSLIRMLEKNDWAMAIIPPRGEGPHQWDPDPKKDTQIRRRFLLLGRTADDAQVWDTRRALAALRTRPELRASRVWFQGQGRAAGIALYAGLFEPSVERFDLHQPPTTHRNGPTFLNVLRILEMPHAAALALPRKVILYDAEREPWAFTEIVAKLYDAEKPALQMRTRKPE